MNHLDKLSAPPLVALPNLQQRQLKIAYTPDSDDVLNFYAWEHGYIALNDSRASFGRDTIIALNRSCLTGEYDVAAVSAAVYPQIANDYWILSCGTSTGRGYGPVLVAREPVGLRELAGKRIAVGGIVTTGSALATMYCPSAELIEMSYHQIADAVLDGQVDAGVMIHEELLYFTRTGLHRVCDLGATWCDETGLPLPVGLNVVHKRVGHSLARQIDAACRDSLQWGLDHLDEALEFASQFGRGCTRQFVNMFSNSDTLSMPADVERALPVLFERVAGLGLAPRLHDFEVIRG
jgi:1,4-dihydroxy-6-naphthoate synthase